ncbi:MAG: hypothetical protein NZ937_04115 [Armatimonadetes bacterium]|nr:hypothetical protein [Armatimonadota bacterium]
MKKQTLWVIGSGLVAIAAITFIIAGCGGGKSTSPKSESIFGSGRTGEIVLTIDWGKSRIIPPSAVKIDVTITGDGLIDPFTDSIPRPQNQSVVTKVYQLPIGVKHVTAQAKDNNNKVVASGSGTATLAEGQRTNLEIVMSEIIQPKTVLVKTFRGKQPASPNFIAFQDGNGPWRWIDPTITSQYTFIVNDPSGRYGVAIVFVTPGLEIGRVEVAIYHATVDELSEINHVSEALLTNFVTVSGTVSGLGEGEAAVIAIGRFQTYVYPSQNTYSLRVPPGTYDLVAGKFPMQQESTANKGLIRRNITVSGDTTINIDFNSPEAFDPEIRNAVIDGTLSSEEHASGIVFFHTHNRTEIMTGSRGGNQLPIQFPFVAIPTNRQFGNDIHELMGMASSENASRLIQRYFKAPRDISATLPSPFGDALVRVATTNPYVRFTASWGAYSGAQAYFAQFGGGEYEVAMARQRLVSNPQPSRARKRSQQAISRSWFVGLSTRWLNGQSSYTLPDFSGLSGWDNNWGFPAGSQVPWEIGAVATNRSIQDLVNAELTPVDGLEARFASKRSEITP